MADVNANIGVNIDTSEALAQLKSLQRQISQFHTSVAKSSETAALAQRDLQRNFINSVNAIGAFSAELRTVKTTAESFTDSLEKNKFSMREYFRYAGASTKTFGRLFKSEFDTIGKVAEDRVKKLQTQYIKLGRDTSGAMKAIAIIPNQLDMDSFATQTQIAAQKQAIFNQLMKQGSTNLLNFGKNTQWAGRQLMVGFTLPLATLGSVASTTFMEMEQAALKFRKVYGDLFTPTAEREQALEDIQALGQMFTRYGIAVSDTVGLAAEAAAAGFQGIDLQRQTAQATRLSVLGQIENQKALETTISLQNSFKMSSDQLASSIDFLNAVENQTVVSLDDITTAIPKVAPVIQQLGGDVKDLAFFMAAMKEGGINASEGANALKSGLAALINPTEKASAFLADMGININKIIETNKGDLKGTVIGFAQALDTLDPLARARAIEQLFGKFQFARLSTLFDNVINQTGQANRVLDLAGTSVEELAALSESELGMTADSAMNKFRKSVEDLKVALVPVGETFLKAVTPIVEFIGGILEKFNGLSEGVKKAIVVLTVAIGAIGPIALMTFGLLANGLANIVKGAMILRNGYLRLTGQTQILGEQTDYLTMEQIDAAAASHSLDQSHAKLTQTFTAESNAVRQLIAAYQDAVTASARFAATNPGAMVPPTAPRKMAGGGIVTGPGSGTSDSIPAMLSNGEAVIPAKNVKKYPGMVAGLVAGNIPGFMAGTVNVGGGAVTRLDFARSDTAAKAQKLIDAMLAEGTGIENALEIVQETLSRMADDTKISIGAFTRELDLVTKELTGSVIPKEVLTAAGRGERKFSAGQTGVGTLQEQVEGNAALQEEFDRAQESSRAAQQAIRDYYEEIGVDLTQTDKKTQNVLNAINQAGEVHRAHVIEMQDNIDKMFDEAWDPDAWVAQSSTLNQVSNILDSSKVTRDEYLKNLEEVNADEAIIQSVREKITNNIALTEQELAVQKQVLERMLASTETVSKLSPSFIAQARGAIAATDYLIENPAQEEGVGSRTTEQKSRARSRLTAKRFRGQESFVPVTQQAQDVVDQIILDTARAAGTQSPSKKTVPIGEDIARGLQVGMQNQLDETAQSGENLATAAIGGVKKGRRVASSPGGTVGSEGIIVPGIVAGPVTRRVRKRASRQGGTVGPGGGILEGGSERLSNLSSSASISQKTKQAIEEEVEARKTSQQRIDSMNRTLMTGTFALTSMAAATSMAGGTLGNISQQVMKYSGLLFALMSVTQLLTQAKVAELAVTRAQGIAGAMQGLGKNAAGKQIAGKVGTLFTRGGGLAGFGKNLLTAGKLLLRFLGPIGLVTSGLLVTFGIINAVNKARERERLAIEGLGDAALLTEGKLKSLGDFFGVAPTKTRLERSGPALILNQEERGQVDQLRASEGFQKEFAKDIQSLEGASDKQAELIFNSLAIQLKGKGFAKEQITTIVKALQEESGKTKIKFDFASIDLATEKGRANLAKTAQILGNSFGKQFATGYSVETKKVLNYSTGEIITVTNEKLSKGLKKSLSTSSKAIAGMFNGLSGQIEQGLITADQFNESFEGISKTIEDMPEPQAMFLLDNILKNMPGDLAKTAAGIKNTSDQLLIAKAAMLGVSTITEAMVKQLRAASESSEGGAARAASRVRAKIKSDMKAVQEMFDLVKKETDAMNKGTGTGGGEDSPFQLALEALQKQRDELKNTTTAYKILIKAGLDAETALKYASDPVIALGLATKGLKPEKIKELVYIMEQIDPLLETEGVRNFFTALNAETKLKGELSTIVPQIAAMGGSLEDVQNILQNPELVSYLTNPLLTAEQRAERIKRYLDGIAAGKEIDIKINLQTAEGIDQEFENRKSIAMEYFDVLEREIEDRFEDPIKNAEKAAQKAADAVKLIQDEIDALQTTVAAKQRNIEMTIDRPIEELQNTINNLQRKIEMDFDRPIGLLQDEATILSEELTVMDKAAEAINQKYDAQADALAKISEINQDIINQQKQQVGLAGALSSGDIAAAAQAAQDMRTSAAEAASRGAGGTLEAARQAELGAQRSASGLTREQIAQRQYDIDRQIYALTSQRQLIEAQILANQDKVYALEQARLPLVAEIRNIEDNIYSIQNGRLLTAQNAQIAAEAALETRKAELQAELDTIDAQRERWEDASLAIDVAKVKSQEFQDKMVLNESLVSQMVGKWNSMQDKKLTVTITEIRNVIVNTITDKTQTKMYGGSIEKMASGGFVPGAGLTDKVPALLTPGEFVMNKAASKEFGPLLNMMNEKKYPGMGVRGSFSEPGYMGASINNVSMPVQTVSNSVNSNSSSVYNYSVGISVGGSNASPDTIAKAVINEIKYIDSQKIRGQRA